MNSIQILYLEYYINYKYCFVYEAINDAKYKYHKIFTESFLNMVLYAPERNKNET